MMRRWISLMVCLSVLVLPVVGMASGQPAATGGLALVRIVTADEEGVAVAEASGATLFARLGGQSFLAGADAEQRQSLASAGVTVTVVDPVLQAGGYYLGYPMPGAARPDLALYGEVLWNEREMAVLHASAEGAAALAGTGVKVVAVTLDPKPWQPHAAAQSFPTVVDLDPVIHMMVDQVTLTDVYSYTGGLSGEWPVEIGGSPYTIATRYTYSGTPIQKATQYVGEWLGGLGLDVEYHQWSGPTYPNVIAELPGSVNPDQIYIIGGHLDDVPSSGPAPGADDNASASVATLLAAEILTQFEWGCTLRFAFWTGEEQGLHGSAAYAQRAYNLGEDIQGYLNLDMIAWNTPNSSPEIELHAKSSIPPTLELAQLFADVVEAYNLDLIPEIVPSGLGASDHASFWNYGYTAILGIEDYSHDFNPRYHTSGDRLEYLDLPYYTDFVKAAVGTFAHMTGCLIPGGIGTLSGTVTAADGGAPIEGATVVVEDDQGHEYPTTTGASGIYSRMFLADAYTATVSVYGYVPAVVPGIVIVTDTVTVQDFALETDPVIWVEPPALAATLEPGGVVTHTLWITNAGGAELTFTLHEVTGTAGMAAGGQIAPAAWEPAWAGASELELTLEVGGAVAARGEAQVIIALREEPDLSGAYEIEDWAGRGQYVYDALQAHWEREGAGALESWLAAAGADPQALPAANAIAATVDEALLRALAGRPEVARVELDRPVALSDTFLGEGGGEPQGVEWNIAKIRADEVWSELGVTGEGVSVGNVGTGVMYTHEALVAQYRGNLGGGLFDHNYHWYDFVNGQPAPYDDNGHSTFGTGVVVGDDGGSNQIGVAPGAEWMAAKACNAYGSCSQADLLAAMAWMLAPTDLNGDNPDPSRAPQVVFNVWGGGTCDTFFQAILDAWQAAGIVPVFAIGGNGPGCMTIASPADLPESFTAGATDANDVIAPFSSRGPSCWDEIKPETAAPGVEIRSSINNGGYSIWSGTSFSAAHLAGTVALVLSADPRLGQEELETVIKETALCIEDLLCGGTPCLDPDGANNVYGWGRIDAFEAVSMTLGAGGEDLLPWLSEVPTAGTLPPGEGMAIAVRFDATGLEPGVYVGLLDVESNDPLTPLVSVPVTLTVEPPCDPLADVGLSWEPPTPTAGEVVTLTAEARGTEPIAFEWDLGDGTVAAGAVVTHTYGVSGTYTVVLTATNPCSQEVVVEPITVVAEGVALRIYLPIMLRK